MAMKLPGRLQRTTLGDVLGALHRDRATGSLELVERSGVTAGRKHRVHLVGGLVAAVDTSATGPRLGEILHREGFLGADGAARLIRRLGEQPEQRVGELLVEDSMVSPEVVDAALRYQLRARLDALFELEDAAISFHVLRRRPSVADRVVPLSPHEFLHDRPRARDERSAEPPATAPPEAAARPAEPSRPRRAKKRDPARTRALAVLGLDGGADRDAVQRAFRRLASKLHPDRFPDVDGSERARLMRRFAEVSAAYHLLVA